MSVTPVHHQLITMHGLSPDRNESCVVAVLHGQFFYFSPEEARTFGDALYSAAHIASAKREGK